MSGMRCYFSTRAARNACNGAALRNRRTGWTTLVSSLVLLAAGLLQGTAQAREPGGQPQLDLPRLRLNAGMHLIDAQVALSPQQRQVGLMFRREMAPNEGMLFVFEQAAVQCFWMKNTLLPLTAAFVQDDGRIVNLADMTPLSEQSHCSDKPVRYVLEMHQGWFEKRGIQPGALIGGLRGPLR